MALTTVDYDADQITRSAIVIREIIALTRSAALAENIKDGTINLTITGGTIVSAQVEATATFPQGS
jgi:hypothetical protein